MMFSPHFSHPLYCIGAMIQPDYVAFGRPPQRTQEYVCGGLGVPACGSRLVRSALLSLRDKNLCIIRASVSSHEYHDICGERDGVEFAKRRRRDVCGSRTRSDKEIDAVPPPPFGLKGLAGGLCVARRRRCPCIASSSLLGLPSQAPSANIMLFMGRDTSRGRGALRAY